MQFTHINICTTTQTNNGGDEIPGGTFHGGDEIPGGTFH